MSRLSKLVALAFAVAVAPAGAAPNGGRIYKNEAARVHSFEAPPGWQPAPQASYPRLLCAFSHPDGGRLTLVQQKAAVGVTAAQLAAAAVPGLEKQGFSDVKAVADPDNAERARVTAKLDGGRRFLLQLYVVDGGAGWVLSLAASSIHQPQMLRDFESAARSLVLVPDDGAR
jgi:hypothetical protein